MNHDELGWLVVRGNSVDTSDRLASRTKCANCSASIEDRGVPAMTGPDRSVWVHVNGGQALCNPGSKDSPRAIPTTETE
jgi:hypothetical protein